MNEQFERFSARTMGEALEKVREKFGHEAMIMGSRKFRAGGFLGFGSREMVEVYVADTRPGVQGLKAGGRRSVIPPSSAQVPPAGEADPAPIARPPIREDGELQKLQADLGRIENGLSELLHRPDEKGSLAHPFLRECYDLLLSNEVEPRIADAIVAEIEEQKLPGGFPAKSSVDLIVRDYLARYFEPNRPMVSSDGPRILFLIGPTGVGKTTTIAKLASRAKINQRRKVGLITLDTYRIGAVDQLTQYADIFKVPVHVIQSPEELSKEVEKCAQEGDELIFVDSAGRSPQDELKMSELKKFINALPQAEVHLVLSTTTHPKTLSSIAERFTPMGFDRVILTKLDESVALGPLVGSLLDIGKPVSYVTDGQNVPKDIFPADPERLVDFVMNKQKA
ncbi:MAG: flagellar biosynthesis protein FlhF [Planctomycetota bacterium]